MAVKRVGAARRRKGVSEVYSALLVLIIAVGVTAAVYTAAATAARGVDDAGLWVARMASDAAAPTVLLPEVRNGSLWVQYESMGSQVSMIIVADPATGEILAKVKTEGYKGEVIALQDYDCRPVAVAAVLETGTMKVYDARKDPRLATLATTPYFSCEIMENASQSGTVATNGTALSETLGVEMGNLYLNFTEFDSGPEEPTVTFTPLQEPAIATATLSIEFYRGDCLEYGTVDVVVEGRSVTLEPYEVWHPYGWSARGVKASVAAVGETTLSLAVLCERSAAATIIVLADNPFKAYIRAELLIENAVIEDAYAPGLYLLTRGSSDYTTNITVLRGTTGTRVEAATEGTVESLNSEVVLSVIPASTTVNTKVALNLTIEVLEIGHITVGAPIEVPLPQPPFTISIRGYTYKSQIYGALIQAPGVLALLEPAPTYYIKVSGGGAESTTPLQPGGSARIPHSGLKASIEIRLEEPCSPVALPGTPVIENINLGYKIMYASSQEPTPLGSCKPHIIKYRTIGRGSGIIAVKPTANSQSISYLGQEWKALAITVSGLGSPTDTTIPLIYNVIDSIATSTIATIDIDTGLANVTPSELPPGLYIALLNDTSILVYTS